MQCMDVVASVLVAKHMKHARIQEVREASSPDAFGKIQSVSNEPLRRNPGRIGAQASQMNGFRDKINGDDGQSEAGKSNGIGTGTTTHIQNGALVEGTGSNKRQHFRLRHARIPGRHALVGLMEYLRIDTFGAGHRSLAHGPLY